MLNLISDGPSLDAIIRSKKVNLVFSLLLHHLHELVKVDGPVSVHVVLDHKVQHLVLCKHD